MKEAVFATGNPGKMKEIRAICTELGIEIRSMKEEGIDVPIDENGTTFIENALIKARTICAASGKMTLADDSGLVVDAMGGAPGIYSARWMGEDASYRDKNAEIIRLLEGVPEEKRTARFICAIACVLPDGRELTAEAAFEGHIGYEERGANGFGYDPIFFLPEYGCTSAELSPEAKNAISHRGQALRMMKEKLKALLEEEA